MTVEELCLCAGRADATDDAFVASIQRGEITVRDGALDLSGLSAGQYCRIVGSTFNDGLHCWPVSDMVDAEFAGEVMALAIPPAVISLSVEIEEWVRSNKKALDAPYASESFGGYTYSKEGVSVPQSGSYASTGWRAHFRDQLNQWRRL